MWEDSIVEEVRQARREIEHECDNDFRKIYERAAEIQKRAETSRRKPTTKKALVTK